MTSVEFWATVPLGTLILFVFWKILAKQMDHAADDRKQHREERSEISERHLAIQKESNAVLGELTEAVRESVMASKLRQDD